MEDDVLEQLKKVLPNASPQELATFAQSIQKKPDDLPSMSQFRGMEDKSVPVGGPALPTDKESIGVPEPKAQLTLPTRPDMSLRGQLMQGMTPDKIQQLREQASPNKWSPADVLQYFPRLQGAAGMIRSSDARNQAYAQNQLNKLGSMTQQDREYARQMGELGIKQAEEGRKAQTFSMEHPHSYDDLSSSDKKLAHAAYLTYAR